MNKELYGKKFELPEEVVVYLQKCSDAAVGSDNSTEGYRRNKELRDNGNVTYQQLKRMKNFFDNFNGDDNDLSFILNGGHYVKNWVDKTLKSSRDSIDLGKEVRSIALDNQYNKEHEKGDIRNMNRPSKEHSDTLGKYNLQVTESLRRINDLIKKII